MRLYLYDPRYNLKTETTYKKLEGIFGLKISVLTCYKSRQQKLKGRYYIIDDKTPIKYLKELYSKEIINNEVWKTIEGSNDNFLISNFGRFKRIYKSSPNGKFIMPYFINRKTSINRNKQFIKVQFKGIYKEYNVARLVAYHFVDIFQELGKPMKYKNYNYDDVVVYHKNGLVYDNYHLNLEWLDRYDLAKKTAYKGKGGRTIVAIDANTNEIIDYYRSTRHVEANLPVSKSAVTDSLNRKWKTNIVAGKYIFKYEDELEGEYEG